MHAKLIDKELRKTVRFLAADRSQAQTSVNIRARIDPAMRVPTVPPDMPF